MRCQLLQGRDQIYQSRSGFVELDYNPTVRIALQQLTVLAYIVIYLITESKYPSLFENTYVYLLNFYI